MNRWQAMGVVPVVFAGAAFGFFYAWVCSTLWGLDTLAPQAASATDVWQLLVSITRGRIEKLAEAEDARARF